MKFALAAALASFALMLAAAPAARAAEVRSPDGRITAEANPNGALDNIAGICSEGRNVVGLMPHPERAAESLLGSEDGRLLFESVLAAATQP